MGFRNVHSVKISHVISRASAAPNNLLSWTTHDGGLW